MLYQVRYILGVIVEAEDDNDAGGKGRKSVAAHAENDWWNEHLLDVEVEKIGNVDKD